MTYELRRTAGDLWSSLVYVTDEHQLIDGYAFFASLVLAQAEQKMYTISEGAPDYEDFSRDLETIRKLADVGTISLKRDMSISPVMYAQNVTSILKRIREIMPICVRYRFVEFSDGTVFSGYGRGE